MDGKPKEMNGYLQWFQKIMKAAGVWTEQSASKTEQCACKAGDRLCVILGASAQENLPYLLSDACVGNDYVLIAADGGYRFLTDKRPDYVVGDFDSLGFVPHKEQIIRHPVRKDDTDMLLAVKTAIKLGCMRIVILGGMGGRLDHTLANLQVLAYIREQGGRAVLIGEKECAFLATEETVEFEAMEEGTVSVFAYSETAEGVCLKGLSYGLENATLTTEFPLGVSNEFTGAPASISVSRGLLLILCENPLMPKAE